MNSFSRPLNRDMIKYFAMLTMLLNHIGNVFLPADRVSTQFLLGIGYFTAITMCYFMTEGYRHTRSKPKYFFRLLLFAVLSQYPFYLALHEHGVGLNMIFTLLICFCICLVDDKLKDHTILRILLNLLLIAASFWSDWAIFAPVFTLVFLRFGRRRNLLPLAYLFNILFFALVGCSSLWQYHTLSTAALYTFFYLLGPLLSAICILFLYNGKRAEHGRTFHKWFFYIFYPLHLLILGLIHAYL